MNDSDTQTDFALTPKQFQAACLLATGETASKVAETVGVARQTVSEWRNHNLHFQCEVSRRKEELWTEAKTQLTSVVPKAIDVLVKTLDDKNARVRMSAARTILEQVRGLASLTIQPPQKPIMVEPMGNEEIERFITIANENEARKLASPIVTNTPN